MLHDTDEDEGLKHFEQVTWCAEQSYKAQATLSERRVVNGIMYHHTSHENAFSHQEAEKMVAYLQDGAADDDRLPAKAPEKPKPAGLPLTHEAALKWFYKDPQGEIQGEIQNGIMKWRLENEILRRLCLFFSSYLLTGQLDHTFMLNLSVPSNQFLLFSQVLSVTRRWQSGSRLVISLCPF